ncbi:DNA repair protein RAD14 [Vairimorpha necatrix]|uniref:DNA repair protein RAD14 n=1 Tax=Vairimorpha necatrix TaxID=6039 RepID=A0AAX4JDK6_9MICR
MEEGFFVDTENIKQLKKQKIEDLPYDDALKCKYCDSPFIDSELYTTFNINSCKDCKYKNIKFITKTSVFKDYLLSEYDIRNIKYISRPNPHKGNWHDMLLYLEEEIKNISINKYGSEEEIEKNKNKKKEIIKNRKIKKLKMRVRELKRKTIVQEIRKEIHEHKFEGSGIKKKCQICGLEIEQEII